jgi:hypothetical protein
MNELAREIGIMEPDDPNRPSLLKGLSALTQLRPSVRSAGNQSTEERMNELAREMITLKPGDPYAHANCPGDNPAERLVQAG